MKTRIFLLCALLMFLCSCSSGKTSVDGDDGSNANNSADNSASDEGPVQEDSDTEASQAFPDILEFSNNPSDQFLVDLSSISDGHPHKGKNTVNPHGAHVHFNDANPQWDNDSLAASDYPAIYAVADGSVFGAWEWTQVGSNYRYGIDLAFATRDGKTILFQYSIEPMTDPGDSSFYQDFILVTKNQMVKKGEVIAYMYIPFGENQGTHIHFGLNDEDYSQEMAPAIFDDSIVQDFYETWNTFKQDGGTDMPACMGYRITDAENPFGTGAKDCLN